MVTGRMYENAMETKEAKDSLEATTENKAPERCNDNVIINCTSKNI
jgi:hypothetical protein